MAAKLAEALGIEVVYNDISPDAYRALGFDGADDIGNMFQFKRDFNTEYCGARNVEVSRSLSPTLQSFAGWLGDNAAKIPV